MIILNTFVYPYIHFPYSKAGFQSPSNHYNLCQKKHTIDSRCTFRIRYSLFIHVFLSIVSKLIQQYELKSMRIKNVPFTANFSVVVNRVYINCAFLLRNCRLLDMEWLQFFFWIFPDIWHPGAILKVPKSSDIRGMTSN